MSNSLRRFDTKDMAWQTHPTVHSILLKTFENKASGVGYDAVLVQLKAGDRIDWHWHPESTETVYIIQGTGKIYGVEQEAQQAGAEGLNLTPGVAVTIPIALRHAVDNTGSSDMLILAIHSPATI